MIKLFLTDIDGTLLPEGGSQVNPAYFEVIRKVMDKGVLFGVSTGRQIANLQRMFEPIWEDMVLVGENGACVVYKGKEILCQAMTPEVSKNMVKDIRALPGCTCFYDTRYMCYVESPYMYHIIRDQFGYDVTLVEDLTKVKEPCLKLTVYRDEKIEEVTGLEFHPKWEKRANVACGGSKYLDVVARGTDKGVSVKMVQDMLGISPEETLVIGDNINDMSTLALAGCSFAIGNAREEVKEACRFIAPDNNHDGVLKVLEDLLENYDSESLFKAFCKQR